MRRSEEVDESVVFGLEAFVAIVCPCIFEQLDRAEWRRERVVRLRLDERASVLDCGVPRSGIRRVIRPRDGDRASDDLVGPCNAVGDERG